jgi:hypothetical protein
MQKIIALVIVLAGIGGGLALGVVLRPNPDGAQLGTGIAADDAQDGHGTAQSAAEHDAAKTDGTKHGGGNDSETGHDREIEADRDYVKVGRQIIIPVVNKGETQALMLFDLAIDVPASMTERAYAAEPRLRDAFLRELFEMSFTGAFSTTYTDERVVDELRRKLRAAARRLLGDMVDDVLILDIMRQEL